jgi:signal transduction histidine kinase
MTPRVLARVVPAIALAVLTSAMTSSDAFADAQPRYAVLAIHWGPEDYPATPVVNAAIRQALTSDANVPIDYFTEYLESDILDVRSASEALAEYIRRKYRERRIDVVLAIADPALRFVLDYRTELFPNAAIVYSGVAAPESEGRPAVGVTGELRGTAYVETLEFALKLHPSTEQVFVIANSHDAQNVEAVHAALDALSWPARLVYLDQPSVSGLIAAVAAIPPRSLVLYVWYSERERGSLLNTAQAARLVAEAAAVPVYGTNERYIGSGVVGGVVRSTQETGIRLAQMARQIIAGKRVEDIPFEDARLAPIVDWRQVLRWRINPSRLPDGSDVRFKVPGVWESYGSSLVVVFLIIAAQLVLIAGLVRQRTRRRGAEDALRANEATLRTSYDRIRQLAGRLMTAQETTRASIARGLHDDVCQDLVALSLAICRLKDLSKRVQNARVQQELSRLQQWTMALADNVRRLSHDLHPATLGLLGLASAIKGHCLEVRKGQGVDVRFVADGDLGHIDREVAVCLFRMAQEALHNGLVHGNASHLVVTLARTRGNVELTVVDDGAGFDPEAARRNGSGLGLVSMEERAYALGGEFHVASSPGLGTTVYVRVPAAAATAQEPATTSACVGTPEPDAKLTAMEGV